LHANLLGVFPSLAQHLPSLFDRLFDKRVGVIKHINQGLGDLPHRVSNFKRGTLSLGPPPSISSPSRRQDWDDYGSTQLDDLGNWLNFSDDGTADARTHNTANEIESRTYGGQNRTIAYDAAGNLETLQTADNAFWMFVYDYRNRVIEVKHKTTPPAEWASIAKYFYDAFNRRIEKVLTTGNDVVYLYEGWRCIEEREWDENGEGEEDDAWEPRRQYVYGGIYIDEPLIFDKDTDDDGACDDARYFYCQQANYNVVAMADSTGASVETVTYDPYGQPTLSGTATGNPLLFQGQRYDTESGLYYFRNRYYSPLLGRFVQRDPMGYGDGWNLHEFVSGSSISLLDPLGLWDRDFHYDLTLKLASRAGIACAEEVAAAANRPDEDERAATDAFVSSVIADANVYMMINNGAGPGDILSANYMSTWMADNLKRAAEWHFPLEESGRVEPGGRVASAKVDAGIETCDFTLFSEGLHPFQDSWSHQGTPYIRGVGHWRGVKRDAKSGKWVKLHNTATAALSHSADNTEYWPEDARRAANASYQKMLKFKERCPCHCPGGKPTSSGPEQYWKDVAAWLLNEVYPGDNVVDNNP